VNLVVAQPETGHQSLTINDYRLKPHLKNKKGAAFRRRPFSDNARI
jgi:hypothetical protein